MIRNKTGVWGELYAARYLRDRGYYVLSSNYTCRFGEIDIAVKKDGVIHLVEVKTRNYNSPVRPMEAVDETKKNRLIMASKHYLKFIDMDDPVEFDVAEVYLDDNNELVSINYIENAFE